VRSFGRLSERLYRTPHSLEDELDWMVRQGPRTPELLTALREQQGLVRAFVFFTYLYYPTAFGLPLVCEKSAFVPTVHDEPPARFAIFHPLFHLPRAIVWQTPEERATAERLFRVPAGTGEVAGFGVEPIEASRTAFRERHGLGDYLLFLGRIDVWKGVPELLERFARIRAVDPGIELVLAGSERMRIPRADGVRFVGYLGDAEKREALAGALATVVPSAFESLSIVALESFAAGTPVLANAASDVLAGQCRRSGGGLAYGSDEDFAAAIRRLRSAEGRELGERGRRFVEAEASWPRVLEVYRRAIRRAAGAT
jgi:glycosyltransferase involved in cell wall biosynthesis